MAPSEEIGTLEITALPLFATASDLAPSTWFELRLSEPAVVDQSAVDSKPKIRVCTAVRACAEVPRLSASVPFDDPWSLHAASKPATATTARKPVHHPLNIRMLIPPA